MCRNVSTSGYSSFTDSQIFFGTQFWPENSQSTSQDMSLSSSSQEVRLISFLIVDAWVTLPRRSNGIITYMYVTLRQYL